MRQDTQTAISWNWNNVFNKEQEDIKHSPKTGQNDILLQSKLPVKRPRKLN